MRQDQRSGSAKGQRSSQEAGRRIDRYIGQKPIQPKRRGSAGPPDRLSGLSAAERQLYDTLVSGEAWLRQRPLDGHWLVGHKTPARGEDGAAASFDYVGEETVWALMDRQLVDRFGRPVADRQQAGPRGGGGQALDPHLRQEAFDGIDSIAAE